MKNKAFGILVVLCGSVLVGCSSSEHSGTFLAPHLRFITLPVITTLGGTIMMTTGFITIRVVATTTMNTKRN